MAKRIFPEEPPVGITIAVNSSISRNSGEWNSLATRSHERSPAGRDVRKGNLCSNSATCPKIRSGWTKSKTCCHSGFTQLGLQRKIGHFAARAAAKLARNG